MADAVVSIKIDEIKELAAKLNSFALSGSDRANLLEQMGGVVRSQTRERFVTKIDPEGNPWQTIAESTQKYIARYFKGADPPLVRKGYLQGSIQSVSQGNDTVLVGSNKEYAEFHQFGTRKMKARQFLGLATDNIAELGSVIDAFIKKKMG